MPKNNHVDRKNGEREYRYWPSHDHPTPTLRFPAEFLQDHSQAEADRTKIVFGLFAPVRKHANRGFLRRQS